MQWGGMTVPGGSQYNEQPPSSSPTYPMLALSEASGGIEGLRVAMRVRGNYHTPEKRREGIKDNDDGRKGTDEQKRPGGCCCRRWSSPCPRVRALTRAVPTRSFFWGGLIGYREHRGPHRFVSLTAALCLYCISRQQREIICAYLLFLCSRSLCGCSRGRANRR
jgi:hypothetical protein